MTISGGAGAAIAAGLVMLMTPPAEAQRPAAAEPAPSSSARQSAPIDLTGQWVSIVNEDWRQRMLTPSEGDYAGVPLNEEGRKAADDWTPSQDGSCKAYGAGGLMRMPTRVRIAWESDDVLRIESDSGRQVRRFHFTRTPPAGQRTLQGRSVAVWERTLPRGDGWGFRASGPPRPGGSLKVLTTDLQPGWLRKNGAPYGENATIIEHYDRFSAPGGGEWFVVTTIVDDPQYLRQPYITSSHFRREPPGSNWNPRPCKTPGR